jgi:hypothetical protein
LGGQITDIAIPLIIEVVMGIIGGFGPIVHTEPSVMVADVGYCEHRILCSLQCRFGWSFEGDIPITFVPILTIFFFPVIIFSLVFFTMVIFSLLFPVIFDIHIGVFSFTNIFEGMYMC